MLAFLVGASVLTACAAWTDLRTGHIPNRLTIGGLALAVAAHFVHGTSLAGLGAGLRQGALALGGALLCAVVPLLMYLRGGMGGGDVKLFAALGAALHPLVGLEAETYAFVSAAVIAPAKLAWDGVLLRTLWNTAALVTNPFRAPSRRREVPESMRAWFRLGPAVFMGTLATVVVHGYQLGGGR